ncbi:tripartite tricarboxylate transporter substrate binding protein [Prauserella alba]|uniref:Tripartite tricarboxylate transporter substrate binding protein n=1 Tax=Prauserella alba TaxID=176898 RepID=A0ABN1VIP2_9PSEU|nr:tripartite tricarboxylate transporter substrate binding protein [Prauserella alba]MCP2183045.1 Tripartite-type tricarboxylate transporter, receptor component TctC [Prauserella alba]
MATMRRSIAAVIAGTLLTAATACAQTGGGGNGGAADGNYPNKPIELIVGFNAGGSTDTGARLMAKALEKKLDATITVVNKPAANSQVAYTYLSRAKPDGYTMAAVTFPSAIITVLDESRGANYERDSFVPAALQVVDPTAVAVSPDSDYEKPKDLVNAAKKNPGTIQATTTGVASNEHFALAQLEEETGAKISPVHFADGATDATAAFLGGNADVLLGNVSDMQQLVDSGKAKVIGVMESERSPFLPEVPTFTESGYDVEMSSSRGYAFPAGTPDEVVDKVSTAMGQIIKEPEFQQKMKDAGLAPKYMNADEYASYWDETSAQFESLLPLVKEEK